MRLIAKRQPSSGKNHFFTLSLHTETNTLIMKESALKYGCNPNQKPSRIFIDKGELPIEVLNGQPGYINFLDALNS